MKCFRKIGDAREHPDEIKFDIDHRNETTCIDERILGIVRCYYIVFALLNFSCNEGKNKVESE
jgi:hypothetical protein